DGFGQAEICDWDAICRAVADLTPLWEPGTATGYHWLTYGWILGELARRVDKRPFGAIVHDEICRPLGIVSLFVGIPDDVEPRTAMIEMGPPREGAPEPPVDALIRRALPASLQPLAQWA